MRMKYMALLLAGAVLTAGNAGAEDGVYVDLSVLNELQPGYAGQSVSQPLFPIVEKVEKKQPVKKVRKAKAKAAKANPAPVKKVEPASVPEPEKAAKPAEPATPQSKEPQTVSKPAVVPTVSPAEVKTTAPAAVVPASGTESVSPSVVKKPDALRDSIARSQSRAQKAMDATAGKAAAVSGIPAKSAPASMITPPSSVTQTETLEVEEGLGLKTEEFTPENTPVYTPEPTIEPTSKPVPTTIPASASVATPTGNALRFSSEADELTDVQKQQLDAILAAFADPEKNKIAITSYNVEGGDDVFRRKRISLNRATGIRSYLLGKGYKNYSIKIINIPEGDDRTDTVDVTELK